MASAKEVANALPLALFIQTFNFVKTLNILTFEK